MAKNNVPTNTTNNNPFQGFINVDLSDDDKAFVSDNWQKAKYNNLLPELVDAGKVSFSYNDKNNTYNCAIVFYGGDLKNWCVSSFAPSPLMALFITWLKLDRYGNQLQPNATSVNRPTFG